MPQTLYDKIWAQHSVKAYEDGQTLLYIDRHLVQEVSSPQAFEGLKHRSTLSRACQCDRSPRVFERALRLSQDQIDIILAEDEAEISAFETRQMKTSPWLHLNATQRAYLDTFFPSSMADQR